MSYEIEVTDVSPQHVAAVKINTTLKTISADIEAGFGKLMQGLEQGGASPSGPPLIVYHQVIDENTAGDLEICAPVAESFLGAGEVNTRQLEGGAMATTIHRGPYENIRPAYQSLMRWIPDNGYEIAGPPREVYLNDPQEVAPEELLTRVEFPVRSAG